MASLKHRSVFVLGVVSALALSGCGGSDSGGSEGSGPAALVEDGTLTVCASNGTFVPMYQTENGKLTGFAPDLAREVGKKWHVKVKFEASAFAGQIPALQSGRCDYVQELDYTADRAKIMDSIKFMQSGYALLVPRGNPDNITTQDDLAGKTIAVLDASSAGGDLEKLSKTLEAKGLDPIKVQRYPGAPESYAATVNKKADAVLDQLIAVQSIVKRLNGDLEWAEPVFPVDPAAQMAMYLKKDSKLTGELAETLQELYDDGTIADLATKNGIKESDVVRPEQG